MDIANPQRALPPTRTLPTRTRPPAPAPLSAPKRPPSPRRRRRASRTTVIGVPLPCTRPATTPNGAAGGTPDGSGGGRAITEDRDHLPAGDTPDGDAEHRDAENRDAENRDAENREAADRDPEDGDADAVAALDRFLRPEVVAVVGASRRPGTIGNLVFRNLIDGEFTGVAYPVNPNTTAIRSVAAYPSLAACPRTPDVAIVCVPAPAVIAVVDEAADLGIRAVCVISAGFAEAGEEGAERQRQLLSRARARGVRIIGPNCMGLLTGSDDVRLNATFSRRFPDAGAVAFASQSGALGLSVLEQFDRLGLGLSSFVSVGNKADISANDLLLYWDRDPNTDVILLYLESFGNPIRFGRIARRISRQTPIVAVKAGRSTSGQRAAASHTGALAAGDLAVDALFAQTGVIRTDSLHQMLGVAGLLATQPPPQGKRTAILTNGGGPGILAADACEAFGLTLPALSDDVRRHLGEFLAAEAGTSNPVDMIASATAEQYEEALRTLLTSGEVDAVMVVFIPPILTDVADVADAIVRACEGAPAEVTVTAVFMNGDGAHHRLATAGVPSYAFPEEAARALAHAARWSEWRNSDTGTVVRPPSIDRAEARRIVAAYPPGDDEGASEVAATGTSPEDRGRWMDTADAERLLTAYGVPFASSHVVHTPAQAADAQRRIAAPVAVKVAAAIHKRDVGGVVVDRATPEEAAAAVEEIEAALEHAGLAAHAGSYLVQEMVTSGTELLIGVTHDPAFGPLVMVGLGGTLVELLGDVAVGIAPLRDVDVDRMLASLRSGPILTGYRGSPPLDVDSLRDLLHRVSTLVEDFPEVTDLDLNPVFLDEERVVAVDVRLRLHGTPAPTPSRSRA